MQNKEGQEEAEAEAKAEGEAGAEAEAMQSVNENMTPERNFYDTLKSKVLVYYAKERERRTMGGGGGGERETRESKAMQTNFALNFI